MPGRRAGTEANVGLWAASVRRRAVGNARQHRPSAANGRRYNAGLPGGAIFVMHPSLPDHFKPAGVCQRVAGRAEHEQRGRPGAGGGGVGGDHRDAAGRAFDRAAAGGVEDVGAAAAVRGGLPEMAVAAGGERLAGQLDDRPGTAGFRIFERDRPGAAGAYLAGQGKGETPQAGGVERLNHAVDGEAFADG
jgi:hypothetical protein